MTMPNPSVERDFAKARSPLALRWASLRESLYSASNKSFKIFGSRANLSRLASVNTTSTSANKEIF